MTRNLYRTLSKSVSTKFHKKGFLLYAYQVSEQKQVYMFGVLLHINGFKKKPQN